ncbi:hypothetical protein QYE76_032300 [Lolium multiflorum]|uniref:Uncharacterized protein n=1 Tax=Lolium multiflorum TaxID=4521 RepID=A0AAD8VI79_LOLMU|nr:hypothetical protein QYE76_032300 [Lolium multiflorum]
MVKKKSVTTAASSTSGGAAAKPPRFPKGAPSARPPAPAPPAPSSSVAKPRVWTASTVTKRDEKRSRSLGIISSDEGNVILPAVEEAKASPAKRSIGGFADEDDLLDWDEGFVEPPSKKAKSNTAPSAAAASEASAPQAAPAAQASTASSLSKGKDVPATTMTPPSLDGAIKKAAMARQEVGSLKEELGKLKEKLKEEETRAAERMSSFGSLLWLYLDKTLGQLVEAFAVDTKEVIEVFPVPSFVDDSSGALPEVDRIQRMKDRINQMEKYLRSTYALAAIVNKKSEIATDVERYALTELHKATESLNCKFLGPDSLLSTMPCLIL